MRASDDSEGNRKNSFNGRVTEPLFNQTQGLELAECHNAFSAALLRWKPIDNFQL